MSDFSKLPLGVEDFKDIIQNNSYYIDKTSFIKQISSENVALYARPRRFGKTLTMSTVKNFFEMNYANPSDISKTQELFKNLAISKDTEFCQKYMGQNPVIFLSLKEVHGKNFAVAISKFADLIYDEWDRFSNFIDDYPGYSKKLKNRIGDFDNNCYEIKNLRFINTPEEDATKITGCLKLLAQVLYIVFKKKPIVIIDEYDVPLEKSRGKYYRAMVDFISALFSTTFKTNEYLEKGFLTGCLRVSRESIFTGFNNLQVYDCATTKYAELFGFTNEEVKQLLKDYNLSDKYDVFKEWYDGYQIGNSEIYNPYSVLTYVDALIENVKEEPVNAWINASSNNFLTEFINYLPNSELTDFKKLLDGGTVEKVLNMTLNYGDIEKHDSVSSLWTLLYVTGYLTKVGDKHGDIFTLKIPNKEVRKCFQDNIVSYFTESPEHYNNVRTLTNAFVNKEDDTVSQILNKILPKYLGLRDVKENLEYTYHSFMDGLLASTELKVDSQKEAGDGYPDISFTKKNSETGELIGIILELKRATSDDDDTLKAKCNEALKQCHDKKYYRKYQSSLQVKHIYMYGIAFCNRTCAVVAEEVLK